MKLKLQKALFLTGFVATAAVARESTPDTALPAPPDKEKVSYALGMRMGQQLKNSDAEVDPDVIAQAIRDVLAGKPTKLQDSEVQPLFMQAQAYGLAKQSAKNKREGATFLEKNAKTPGVTTLPDGLQYRVIQTGTGVMPKTNDLIIVKFRGTFIDGKEFDHNDHQFSRLIAAPKGWQEALQLMKVGSKWQIFVPSDLAYGHEGMPMREVGPDTTLIYDLELVSIEPEDRLQHLGSGRMGHGPGTVFLPTQTVAKSATTNNVAPSKTQ